MKLNQRITLETSVIDVIPSNNSSRKGSKWLGSIDRDAIALVWELFGGWSTAKEALILTPLAEEDEKLAVEGRTSVLNSFKTMTFSVPERVISIVGVDDDPEVGGVNLTDLFSEVANDGRITVTDTEVKEAHAATFGKSRGGKKQRYDLVAGFCRLTLLPYVNALRKKVGLDPIIAVDAVVEIFESRADRVDRCMWENDSKDAGVRKLTIGNLLAFAVDMYRLGRSSEKYLRGKRWETQLGSQYATVITGLNLYEEHEAMLENKDVEPAGNWRETFIRFVVGEEWLKANANDRRKRYAGFFAKAKTAERKAARERAVEFLSNPKPVLEGEVKPKSAPRSDVTDRASNHPSLLVRAVLMAVADNELEKLNQFADASIASAIDEAAGLSD